MKYIIARVPPEILDQIFEVVGNPPDGHHQPRSSLVPLCRVCKYWKNVAEPQLYREITIGGTYVISRNSGDIVAPLLARTLSENEKLAKLVNSLFLGTVQHLEVESIAHAQILAASANVAHVVIYGYSNGTQGKIRAALASLKELRSLEVSRIGLVGGSSTRALCVVPELLQLMSKWPRLEKVDMHHGALDDSLSLSDDESLRTISTPGCCPRLHDFICKTTVFSAYQLRLLASMAPSIASFYAGVEKNDSGIRALAYCLETWSSSLIDLAISSNRFESDMFSPLNSSASLHLDNLQLLSANSLHILPSALQYCPALKTLIYTADADGVEDLISVLRSSSTLNSLEKIVLYRDLQGFARGGEYVQNRVVLRELCKARCIEFR
ncbi:hypothetical protein DFH11DRAFT_493902 [Phellopilus nigrolimitatus]|nr:hypothetical protein DFH11DRAFT_493902 [Phellopilus nigrolimitatus]